MNLSTLPDPTLHLLNLAIALSLILIPIAAYAVLTEILYLRRSK